MTGEVSMPWFAAHAIVYFRFQDGRGGAIPVWENVILVEAPDRSSAARVAEETSSAGEGDFNGLGEIGGRRGEVVFAGIRKVELVHAGEGGPQHGDEISYVELTAPDMASVEALARGDSVLVTCDRVADARP